MPSLTIELVDEVCRQFAQEGASLSVLSIDPDASSVELHLELDGTDCEDCVLPAEYLESLISSKLGVRSERHVDVLVRDRRRPSDGPAPAAEPEPASGLVVVLDPTASGRGGDPDPGPEGGDLSGKTVLIRVDPLWRSWDWTVDEWSRSLHALGAEVRTWKRWQGIPGEEGDRRQAEYEELVQSTDVLISGLANCGSCTAWTVRDAITGLEAGVATMAVATEHFVPLARILAEDGRRPSLRLHVLPYPLDTRPEEEVRRIARENFAPALAALEERGSDVLLQSERHEIDPDPVKFAAFAVERGWGDGLPLVPPVVERVEHHVEASGLEPETLIALIPPLNGECTVERLAINAVMAGAPPEAMPLLVTALGAMSEPDFELHTLNATTASVVPALIVNGEVRHRVGVSYGSGCLGGGDGTNAAVGRAVRLVMRNVGGQRAGVTSQTVFGQPGRTAGIVFAEWEERSPWAPLAERRGVPGDAVTVFGAMGTMNMLDGVADRAQLLLDVIGRSLAYPSANGFLSGLAFSEAVVGLNPVWAEMIGRAYPAVSDAEDVIWEAAALPISSWPRQYHQPLEDAGRIGDDGRVHLLAERERRLLVVVCGGLGGLHGLGIHGFGTSTSITRPVAPARRLDGPGIPGRR